MSYHGEDAELHGRTTSITPQVYQGGAFVGAKADANTNVADSVLLSSGKRINTGKVTWTGHGLAVGAWYFLSQTTAGAITATAPTTGLIQQVLFVEDANTVHVQLLPAEAAAPGGITETLQFVALDTPVTLDNLKIVPSSTQHIRFGTVVGTMVVDVATFLSYATNLTVSANTGGVTLTTTPANWFGWGSFSDADCTRTTLIDRTNGRVYEITIIVRAAPALCMVHIKRIYG
jgi:hypothetical protein